MPSPSEVEPATYGLTFDTDWAPDEAIIDTANLLLEHNVKSTWFITNTGRGFDFLKSHPDYFELGIHPNFLPGSTHGSSWKEILLHCKSFLPEARLMRTHDLFQATSLLRLAREEFNIMVDLSIYLPLTPNIRGHWRKYYSGSRLLRLPYFHDDSGSLGLEFNPIDKIHQTPGLKIYNFHPIHVCLNTGSWEEYVKIKTRPDFSRMDANELRNAAGKHPNGARNKLLNLISVFGNILKPVSWLADEQEKILDH